jgi:hypothetical protein
MRKRSRPAAAALAAVLAASGCGVRPTGIISAGVLPRAEGNAEAVTVYLVRDGSGLRPVTRPGLPGRPYLPIEQLHVRPTAVERSAGLRTEVGLPLSARVVWDASRPADDASRLIVDLAPTVPHRRVSWSRAAVAQIACTAQAVPGIDRVALWSGPDPDKYGWASVRCGELSGGRG